MKKLYGTVIPLVTPLTEEDTIDAASLEHLADHVIKSGMQGLYPCGTTGEMMYLTVGERKQIAEIVVERNAGRLPVFVQTGAWNLKDTIELSRHAEAIGADGIGVVTPAFYRLSDRGLVDFYVSVAQSVSEDFPVYLYGIPQNAINDLGVEVCEEIVGRCANVVGIKYSYADFARIQDLMTVRNQTFSVLAGADHMYAAVCAAGGDGVVSGCAQVIPEQFAALWGAIQKKDYGEAMRFQRRTNECIRLLTRTNSISAFKTILKAEGIIRTNRVRKPLDSLTEEQERELLREMERLDYRNAIPARETART